MMDLLCNCGIFVSVKGQAGNYWQTSGMISLPTTLNIPHRCKGCLCQPKSQSSPEIPLFVPLETNKSSYRGHPAVSRKRLGALLTLSLYAAACSTRRPLSIEVAGYALVCVTFVGSSPQI